MSIYPTVGSLFQSRYLIEELIGTGGFAQIFRATQTDLGRQVAIKILSPNEFTDRAHYDADVERRFYREAQVVSQLKDPNTITVFDFGQSDTGLLFMVMEFIDGQTVAEAIDRDGKFDEERAAKILRQVARSLREAHENGISHGDIKPTNIMLFTHLDEADHAKLLDFGIAHMMKAGAFESGKAGTPIYMSPERIMGKPQTPASDIYSVGLVLYEMLTGRRAIDAESTISVISQHLSLRSFEFPDEIEIEDDFKEIVLRMLEKDPADRYVDTKHLLSELNDWIDSEGEFERRTTSVYKRPSMPTKLDHSTEPTEWLIHNRFRPIATLREPENDVVQLVATDTFLERQVILEVLPARVASEDRVKRFLNNARTFIAESHPSLPRVFDAIESDDTVVVYEHFQRSPIRDVLPITLDAKIHIKSIAAALATFHAHRAWHGLLSLDELAMVEGQLLLTSFGQLFSSSPTNDTARAAKQKADVFRFGVVVWCLLTGNDDDPVPTGLDTDGLDPFFVTLIRDCTSPPDVRPSMPEIVDRFG